MNEFEKELLNKVSPHDRTHNGNELFLGGVLTEHFKDWQPPKQLVEVPQFVADYIESCKRYGSGLIWSIRPDRDANELCRLTYDWLFPNGCRLKDGSFPDPFEPDNLVRPDSNNQLKFIRAWIDGYTVEKPKEKLYFVKLPGVPTINSYMCKSCSPGEFGYHKEYSSKEPNKICFSNRYDKKYSGGWQRQFTESEIKAIDKRYWEFAVKVYEAEL